MHTASQLPGREPTDADNTPAPACLNPNDDDGLQGASAQSCKSAEHWLTT